MEITLEELKRKNAEAKAATQEAQPVEAVEDEAQADPEEPEGEQPEGEEGEPQDVPAWLATGEQTPEGAPQVPVKTHVAMKQKLKGRIGERESEIDQLRQEIQQLKTGATAQQPAPMPTAGQPLPKPDDFYDKPDPDSAYGAAMQSWMDQRLQQQLQTQMQSQQQQQQQQAQQQQINTALDQHYDRAAQIVTDGLLTAEEYQAAETLLRQSVESMAPGSGDIYVNAMLGSMGEGSEKVVVSLARNPSHMMQLQTALREDPSGIKAASYMGELKGKFSGASRVSRTPKPGAQLQGQGGPDGGTDRRQYKAAHKSGNRQKAFNIKRAAKAKGVDVSKW